jgi:hypothetical protein
VLKIWKKPFKDSQTYWENRYRKNGNSGDGSYGIKAAYKATVINEFVAEKNVDTVIELGCGDGNQLKQFYFENYIGFDVSPTAVQKCKDIFKDDASKKFFLFAPETMAKDFTATLTLSLDVIYHLVEDDIFQKYMNNLFSISLKYVIIYAWDVEESAKYHVRHRKFTVWVEKNISNFQLLRSIHKEGFCDFFIYEKK